MAELNVGAVVQHLTETWGPARACPLCGNDKWTVADKLFHLIEYGDKGTILGGSIVPVVPVTCTRCGNTVLINAIAAKGIPSASAANPTSSQPKA